MASRPYDHRIAANFAYDASRVHDPPTDARLARFEVLIWHGQDDEGLCVYKQDPRTGEVLRIDFRA